jgi:Domain of unknown function (DUF5615)
MKFLVDANLSPRVATRLCDGGYEASHVQDHGLLNAGDEKILRHALDTSDAHHLCGLRLRNNACTYWYGRAVVDLAAFCGPPQPYCWRTRAW